MKQNKMFLLFLIASGFLLSACSRSFPSLNLLYKDHMARKEAKAEKYEEALNRYYNLLEEEGDRATTHSNIGVLLDLQQKKEDALKSLQYALKLAEQSNDAQEVFAVRYNLGVYYGSLKKVPEALENYQIALDLQPTSHQIKTNIELLIQQQKQDQQKEQQNKDGEQKQNSDGQGQNQDKKDGEDKDKNNPENKENQQDENKDKQDEKDGKDQEKQSSAKYQPRPFKGDQLSEGDVKKILGELRNQEQKIRANFDKKEKGKTKNNDKDW